LSLEAYIMPQNRKMKICGEVSVSKMPPVGYSALGSIGRLRKLVTLTTQEGCAAYLRRLAVLAASAGCSGWLRWQRRQAALLGRAG